LFDRIVNELPQNSEIEFQVVEENLKRLITGKGNWMDSLTGTRPIVPIYSLSTLGQRYFDAGETIQEMKGKGKFDARLIGLFVVGFIFLGLIVL